MLLSPSQPLENTHICNPSLPVLKGGIGSDKASSQRPLDTNIALALGLCDTVVSLRLGDKVAANP